MNKEFRQNYPLSYHKLKNGLQVCVVSNRRAPIISINLAYKVGSRNEIPGKTGLAHLFEHLMFEGSKNVPKGDFDKLCSLAGGVNNAYTNYELTSYQMTLPPNQLELALWLESDRMASFSVTEESLETQKKVVIEEIHQTVEDQPYSKWRDVLAETAYSPKYSYSWEIQGKKEDIRKFKLEDLKYFFEMFYQPDNACLVIVGDVEADKALKLAENYFEDIPVFHKPKQTIEFSSEYLNKGKSTFFKDNVPSDAVFLCFHCPGFLDNAVLSGDILANIAGNGRSSRLYNTLIYAQQIASQTGAFVDKRESSSLMIFYAFGINGNTTCDELNNVLLEEISGLTSKKITNKEYGKTINQLTSQIANDLQFNYNIADNLGEQILFWNNPERIYSTLDKYKEIKINELNLFLNEFLKPEDAIRIDVLKKTLK